MGITTVKIARLLRNEYLDSLVLLDLSLEISAWPGVRQAVVMMGTESNRRILEQLGLLVGEAQSAGRRDLIMAAEIEPPQSESGFLSRLEDRLKRQQRRGMSSGSFESLSSALEARPDAAVVAISVPGEHATVLARQALEKGRHVFCFSQHVAVQDELALKRLAIEKGRLMMGPDCGTTILDGCGLGFANRVRPGNIGIVSASGSGLQEVTTLIHRGGGGISQAIGVGGRDMRPPMNGLMAQAAIEFIVGRSGTNVLVILAKSAAPEAREQVLKAAFHTGLPLVVDFQSGEELDVAGKNLIVAETFEACARGAVTLAGIEWHLPGPTPATAGQLSAAMARLPSSRKLLRGLYAGGSLCGEAVRIFGNAGIALTTNLEQPLSHLPAGHVLLDLGAEEYTEGRAHPFIDTRLRALEIDRAFADPCVGILLLDVVLGWGCHADPAGAVVSALRSASKKHGPGPVVIASVCGTDEDPQRYADQVSILDSEGIVVARSNASAAQLAAEAVLQTESI